ncbi:MAG: hypothetical protein KAI91_07010, partial [Candidatus Omnitrophica bacterium]|nr:hypothetical protein [Candidatus Omnitrophota bacterium]
VEDNGRIFYEDLENKAKDEKVKEIFRFLKEEEISHGQIFQKMLDEKEDYIIYEFSNYEYESYVKAIASMYIFSEESIKSRITVPFDSEIEAVDFGIQIEKDSILTYLSLTDCLLPIKQPTLYKIIDEEKKHLVKLLELKNYLI